MAKKLTFINGVQENDVTANKAVEKNVPAWVNREKTGYQSHDYVVRLEAELEKEKAIGKAIKAERRKAEKREAEERKAWIDAIVAISKSNADAMKVFAERGIVYSHVTPSGVAEIYNETLRKEVTCNANAERDVLHLEDEKTVQDASVREAKKTATTAKKTAKKDTTTAKKTTTGKGKYTPKAKQGVKYEDEYTVTAKNGVEYKVGHFHHTKTDEELWAVSCVEYSEDAKAWLKDTFGVHWSPFAGGFLFDYKPDTYLRRGSAKKTATKKTAKNA